MEKKFVGELMNIIHIISGDIWAGAEVQVYHTVTALSKQSYIKVTCIVFNNGILKKKLEKKNISTIILDESKYSNLSLLLMLKNLINRNDPDLLHVHAVKEHFLGWFASLLCYRKIPIVRTVHGARKVPDNLLFYQSCRANLTVNMDNLLITYLADVVIAVSKDLEKDFYRKKDL